MKTTASPAPADSKPRRGRPRKSAAIQDVVIPDQQQTVEMPPTNGAIVEVRTPPPPAELPQPIDQGSQLINTIAAAARDPAVDVAKLEKLMDLQERVMARAAEQEFNRAMNRAQQSMLVIGTDAENSQTRSRYATYAKLDMAVRPIYTREGFSLSFDTAPSAQPDHMKVLCHVAHSAGHSRLYSIDIPTDGKGARGNDVMTKTHATGAGVSYGCRYLLKLIWNIAVGEDDQDGNDVSAVRVQEWVDAAMKAKDLDDLMDVKTRGFEVIEKKGTVSDYSTFKRAILERKDQLENPAKTAAIAQAKGDREPGQEG